MLSVIIPAYNEEKNIELVIKSVDSTLTKANIPYEIIFVDDGSKDNTREIIKTFIPKYPITLEGFSRNFGKEAAINCGLHSAKGEVAVIFDADLQFPTDTIVEMYRLWEEGYEVIEGEKIRRQKEGIIYKLGANTFYKLLKKFGNVDLKNATDFKMLDRKVIDTLVAMPERNVFFRALSNWVGFKRTRVLFKVEDRRFGTSKWNFMKLSSYAISNLTSYTTLPMQFVTLAGTIFLIFSIGLGIHTLYIFFIGEALGGFTTVILLLLIIGSIMMLSLGIIGYYLAKIYTELLHRPMYIVQEELKNSEE
ncbi:MAG: glycosyltransferase family 2 protein [Erysipelotrichales bacterium]|nr:glycosyltransferase family 2 protein [Erysipelotrichales bacterium]